MARVAIIVGEMFEDSEFRQPYDALVDAGHDVQIVGIEQGTRIEGKKGKETVETEVAAADVDGSQLDALVIPGGYSPDKLRVDPDMVRLTREVFDAGKPVAAICHAGWMLVEADVADGRVVTSWPSVKTDLVNAGARWVDRELVEDGNLITSRKPDDLPAFCAALLRQIADGPAQRIGSRGADIEAEPPRH